MSRDVDVSPDLKRKEVEELVANGRRLLAVAVRKLLELIESGEATAAHFASAARLVDLLGLDRLTAAEGAYSDNLRRALAELDSEEATKGDWRSLDADEAARDERGWE